MTPPGTGGNNNLYPHYIHEDLVKESRYTLGKNVLNWYIYTNQAYFKKVLTGNGTKNIKKNAILIDRLTGGQKVDYIQIYHYFYLLDENGVVSSTYGSFQDLSVAESGLPLFNIIPAIQNENWEAFYLRISAKNGNYGVFTDPITQEQTVAFNFGDLPGGLAIDKEKLIDDYIREVEGKYSATVLQKSLESLDALEVETDGKMIIAPNVRIQTTVDPDTPTQTITNKAELRFNDSSTITNTSEIKYQSISGSVDGVLPGEVKIIKKDDSGKLLPNIKFKLQFENSSGTFVDFTPMDGDTIERSTNASGEIIYKKLVPGKYRVVETTQSEEYDAPIYSINGVSGTNIFTIAIGDVKGISANVVNPVLRSVTVIKKWDDEKNQDGIRKDNVTVQLSDGANNIQSPVTLNEGNGWTYTWKNLPANKDGQKINYTVNETDVPGYDKNIDQNADPIVITNTHVPEKTTVDVTKNWIDTDNQDNLRPTSITYRLFDTKYPDIEIAKKEVTASEGWKHTFANLDKYRDGEEIVYMVVEDAVPNYSTTYGNNFVVNNSYTPKKTAYTITKEWQDDSNRDGVRLKKVTVELLANGKQTGKTVELNDANRWTHTWENLDVNDGGTLIVYTSKEITDSTYTSKFTKINESNGVIVNSYSPEKISISGSKTWDDSNNQDGERPEKVTVNLHANGVVIASKEITAVDKWEYTFSDLYKYENGKEILYTLSENQVKNYSFEADSYNLINHYTPKETSYTIIKDWQDENNQDGKRPDSIKVQLLADGKHSGTPVELNEENKWTHTWNKLPQKADGKIITYTVNESAVTDYESEFKVIDATNGTLTNSYSPETVAFSGEKIWKDQNNQDGKRPGSIVINLLADNVIVESRTVTKDDNWKYSFKDLAKYNNGKEIEYSLSEDDETNYQKSITDFNVTNSYSPEKTTFSGKKIWNDEKNQDGIRPEFITINLLANGEKVASKTVDATTDWSYSFTDLDKFHDGNEITYSVVEETIVPEYVTSSDGNDIVNTHIPETVNLEGTKTWDDENNQDKERPETITVNLLANGSIVRSKEVTEADRWTYKFTNLPKFENGVEITYTVSENQVPKYSPTFDKMNIKNSYTPKKTTYTVNKVWQDGDNQDGRRPESIQLQLLADGKKLGDPVTIDDSSSWTYTWNDLDLKADGKEITYTVEEVTVPTDYTSVFKKMDGANGTVTNKYTPETRNVAGKKTWDDNKNQDGVRPDDLIINLLADGKKIASKIVTEKDDWAYNFTSLPTYSNGQLIVYTISEEAVSDYSPTINGFDIMNSYTPGKTTYRIQKNWHDQNNQDGKRPNSINVQLLANNKALDEPVTLSSANNWAHTWTELAEKADGKTITYSVKEATVPTGYQSHFTSVDSMNGLLTNSYLPETIDVAGTKTWDDQNNQDGKRPKEITINLLENGVLKDSIATTEKDNWQYAFTNLAKYSNGTEIVYTLTENAVTDYRLSQDGYNLTNHYTPGKTTYNVQKVWQDGNNQDGLRPNDIDVQLLADGKVFGDIVTLSKANNWQYTWEDLQQKASGKDIVYTVKESNTPSDYTATFTTIDSTHGQLTNTHLPETTSVTGLKKWEDKNNFYNSRPEAITIHLLANGQSIATKEVTESEKWEYSFTNLPKFQDGKPIVYTLSEDSVKDYVTSISGYNITNEYLPGKTTYTIQKNWNDDDNQDGLRPTSIEVQLFANGKEQEKPVSLTAANNWTYTWEDLDLKQSGQNIVYTADEVAVPTGYQKTVDYSQPTQGVITNSHVPEIVQISRTKVWQDNDNQAGKRPTAISLDLMADGVKVASHIVSNKEDWRYIFTNLAKYKEGKTINYSVIEGKVADYSSSITGTEVTNTYTPDLTTYSIQKVWDDRDNQDGKRPEEISVQLYANDKKQGEPVSLNALTHWNYQWTGLEKDIDGKDIVYTADEVTVPKDYTKVTNFSDLANGVITNTYTPETLDVKGKKTWDDAENQDGKRPTSIEVHLLANGEIIDTKTVTDKTNWAYEFTQLSKFRQGKEINYTIKEAAVKDYTSTIDGYNLTNHYTPGKTSYNVQKIWQDNDNQDGLRPTEINVQLFANGKKEGTSVTLNEANQWTYTWNNLKQKFFGKEIVYTVDEVAVPKGYTKTIDTKEKNFGKITNSHTPEITILSGEKTWKDNDNQEKKRPESITVNLLANGQVVESKNVTEKDNWKYSFTSLPKFDKQKEISYTVSENPVANYSTNISGTNIINTYTPNKVSYTVEKIWQDGNNQDALRPESINVQLLKDGKKQGKPITLSEKTKWTYTWTDLDKEQDKKTITYSVEEVAVPTGYTAVLNQENPIKGILTNQHTPETINIKGTKTWVDNNDRDKKRPTKIMVNLLADGVVVASKEVTDANNWQYEFTNLNKRKAGKDIIYTITENPVSYYATTVKGYDITNTYTPGRNVVPTTNLPGTQGNTTTGTTSKQYLPQTGENIRLRDILLGVTLVLSTGTYLIFRRNKETE